MNKLIVWALYDDGNSSYQKYFPSDKFNVISIGIQDKEENDNYKKIDLSCINENLLKQLSKLPNPDVIIASPPCESWSNVVSTISGQFRGIIQNNHKLTNTNYFELRNPNWYKNQGEKLNLKLNFSKISKTRLLGEATQIACIEIIEYFKPEIWIIENPESSKCWNYQNLFLDFKDGWMNKAIYSDYNQEFSRKPTIFKSNIFLNFQFGERKQGAKWNERMMVSCYDYRSAIPQKLVEEIADQILEWKETHG